MRIGIAFIFLLHCFSIQSMQEKTSERPTCLDRGFDEFKQSLSKEPKLSAAQKQALQKALKGDRSEIAMALSSFDTYLNRSDYSLYNSVLKHYLRHMPLDGYKPFELSVIRKLNLVSGDSHAESSILAQFQTSLIGGRLELMKRLTTKKEDAQKEDLESFISNVKSLGRLEWAELDDIKTKLSNIAGAERMLFLLHSKMGQLLNDLALAKSLPDDEEFLAKIGCILEKLGSFVHAARDIKTIFARHPEAAVQVSIKDGKKSQKISLVQFLQDWGDSFNNLIKKGSYTTAQTLIKAYEVRDLFTKLYFALSQLDVYLSVASKAFFEHYHPGVFGFSSFLEGEGVIRLQDYWDLADENMLEKSITIQTEAEIKAPGNGHRFLRGDTRAIAFCEHLAATLGVAPASGCWISMPTKFTSTILAMRKDRMLELVGDQQEIGAMVQTVISKSMTHCLPDYSKLDGLPQHKMIEAEVNIQLKPDDLTRFSRINRMLGKTRLNRPMLCQHSDSVVPPTTLKELDILVGSQGDEGHSLAHRIKRTKTHVGFVTLTKHLAQIKSSEGLRKLQGLISALNIHAAGNSKLYVLIQQALESIAAVENVFLSFLLDYQKDTLQWPLKGNEYKMFSHCINVWLDTSPRVQFWTDVTEHVQLKNPIPSGLIWDCLWDKVVRGKDFVSREHAAKLTWSMIQPWLQKKKEDPALYKAMSCYLMKKSLMGLKEFIEGIEKLQELITQNQCDECLRAPFQINPSKEFKQLREYLRGMTYGRWNYNGDAQAGYRLALRVKDELGQLYAAVGNVDFVASLAALIDSSTEANPFCFAEYTAEPSIQIEDGWTPLIKDWSTVVTNDIAIGGSDPRLMLITGPNERGKTTVMRTVAGSTALLASTLGISSATRISVPENLNILTVLNLGDDVSGGRSLFRSVTHRHGQIEDTIEDQPSRPCLLVNDEPFNGTGPEVAQVFISEYLKLLDPRQNVMAMFSTHFKELTHMEREQWSFFFKLALFFGFATRPAEVVNYRVTPGYRYVRGIDERHEDYKENAARIAEEEIGKAFADNVRYRLGLPNGRNNQRFAAMLSGIDLESFKIRAATIAMVPLLICMYMIIQTNVE